MREIRTSGLMSGEGKRGGAVRQCSRLSSTLPEKLKKAVTSWHKRVAQSCAQQRITLRLFPGMIGNRQVI